MGKMGEAANLGAVAIAAFLVYKLVGLKLPKFGLPELPQILPGITPRLPRARDLFDLPDVDDITYFDTSFIDDLVPAVPDPGIKDVLDRARAVAEDHAARVAASRDVLETAKLDLARFQTYVTGNADVDAGGSTDMDPAPAVWGSRRQITR